MNQAATTPCPGEEDEATFNEGYRAQAAGKNMVSDNPHPTGDPKHWTWRRGFLQAFKDSN
jgi:hypothetical protein